MTAFFHHTSLVGAILMPATLPQRRARYRAPVSVPFARVHGAWHGAWCWERLLGPLEARGHRAVAMDLPAEDVYAGLAANADAVASALDGVEDDVVVVAPSLSGLVAPLVAARRPVRSIAYLAAFLPLEGQSMDDQFAASSEPI